MSADLDGRRLKPSVIDDRAGRWRVVPASDMSKYNIVTVTDTVNGYMKATKADADTFALSRGKLYMCRHACIANGNDPLLEIVDSGQVVGVTGAVVDTSGGAVGDPVFLSNTAGGWTLTPTSSTTRRIIGRVLVVNATTGVWEFSGATGSGGILAHGIVDLFKFRWSVLNAVDKET